MNLPQESHAVTVSHVAPLTAYASTPQEVLRAAQLVQQVMRDVMKENEHYGVIPGTERTDKNGHDISKRTLLKSGAEKLCFVFGLSPRLQIQRDDHPNGHREYMITCDLYDRAGNMRGQGVGSASTLEQKYRYRGAAGKPCPSCGTLAARPSKKEYGGGYWCDPKAGGCNEKWKGGTPEAKKLDAIPTARAENPDPADQYNTILKMAKKRAMVDAVLTATAASDCFSQDLDEIEDHLDAANARDAEMVQSDPTAARTVEPSKAEQATPPASASATKKPEPKAPAHPAIEAARKLYTSLGKDAGSKVISRLCSLAGVVAPKDVPVNKLDQFANDVAQLDAAKGDAGRIEDLLSMWEQAAKELTEVKP